MVKSKRDVNSPRKRPSLTKRTITRVLSRPNSAAISSASANIKVVVRVRPPNEREKSENYRNVVKVVDDQMLIFDPKESGQGFFFHGVQQRGRDLLKKSPKDMQFLFDRVFSNDMSNTDVFKNSTYNLIKSLMDGYNCSVFAYGATGAGKTYTMIGNAESPGITFLTMTELFRKREELSVEREFELGITYLEVYNELVRDLLNPGPPLHLREDDKYGVMVAGIKVYKIDKSDQLFSLLDQGNKNRTQHPTDANAESSRSHAVFQVYIHMTIKSSGEVRMAKLSMIDLAGSERGSATNFAGARFTEGANINKSLLALGNCINGLADGLRHVPYRDSKLTRLLKDSLGGNCQTVMIANVAPSSMSFEDTYNTLKYATRAKKIKSNMKRNVVNVDMHVGQYVKMVEDLQNENAHLKKQLIEEKGRKSNDIMLQNEYDKLKQTYQRLCGTGVPDVDENIMKKANALIQERKELTEREYHIILAETGTSLRRQLKEEIDGRLSSICTNTPEKTEAHRKIGNSVIRIKKQQIALKGDIAEILRCKLDIDSKIDTLVKGNPELTMYMQQEQRKLLLFEMERKLEVSKKEVSLLIDDHTEKCSLLEKMAGLLKPCYMQLKGHGFATNALTKQYLEIVQDVQGRRNVRWAEIPDSGVSSTSSLSLDGNTTPEEEEDKPRAEDQQSVDSLDGTFTLPAVEHRITPSKPKVKMCAEQLMAKVYRPPPAKRMANWVSPRKSPRNKENKPLRRPLVAIDTRSTVAAKTTGLRGITLSSTQKSLATRPRFRS